MDEVTTINRRKLKLSNLNKIYWPGENITKGDLIQYYRKVSKYILPYLKNRPESLNRYPNGIKGPSFFQKNMPDTIPDWIETIEIFSEHNNENVNYMVCNNEAALVYMANLGCIEINPWFSTIKNLDNPDYIAIDLDPLNISFEKVIEVALAVKEVLDKGKITGYCKTSGSTGIHIYIPLNTKYDFNIAKEFALVVANLTHELVPGITSLERSPSKRKRKVYLDYLQNRRGQTLAAPYSVRPKPHAPVSAPLLWPELKQKFVPQDFTIKTIFKRLDKTGDQFIGALGKGNNIIKSLKNLGH